MPEPPSLHEATIDVAEVTVRPSLCVPAPGAEKLLMTDFTERWIHLRDPGIAVVPSQVIWSEAAAVTWGDQNG